MGETLQQKTCEHTSEAHGGGNGNGGVRPTWDESFPVKQLANEMDGFEAAAGLNATAGSTPRPTTLAAAAAAAAAEVEVEVEGEEGAEAMHVDEEDTVEQSVDGGMRTVKAAFPSRATRGTTVVAPSSSSRGDDAPAEAAPAAAVEEVRVVQPIGKSSGHECDHKEQKNVLFGTVCGLV